MKSLTRNTISYRLGTIIRYVVLVIIALIVIVPILWVYSNSFRHISEFGKYTSLSVYTFIPEYFTLDNYRKLGEESIFITALFNSLLVTIVTVFLSLIVQTTSGFAFAKFRFPGRNILFAIFLLTMGVAPEILTIGRYFIIRDVGLIDTRLGIILPFVGGAFGVFYMTQVFSDLPDHFRDAAIIDGANWGQIFFRIYLPLTGAALITLGLLVFMLMWDNLQWPATIINSQEKQVLAVYLQTLANRDYGVEYGILYAGVVASTIPSILLYVIFQKYYMQQVTAGGIKG